MTLGRSTLPPRGGRFLLRFFKSYTWLTGPARKRVQRAEILVYHTRQHLSREIFDKLVSILFSRKFSATKQRLWKN